MSNNQAPVKMDLNHLLIFNKIAESRNLTDAAKVLGQEKSRLSRVLSELESTLGVELVYRTTRQFRLTDAGRQLYLKSHESLLALQHTANEFLNREGKLRGRIRLTGAHGVFARMISPVIADFSRRHPQVGFELIFAQQSLDLVKEGIDLAVRMGAPKDSVLKMRKIGEFTAVFGASPRYLSSREAPRRLGDLKSHRLLMLESLNDRDIPLTDGTREERLRLRGIVSSNGPDVLLDLVLAGLGIGLLPEILFRNHVKTREVVTLFPQWKMEGLPVNLIFAHKRQPPPHVRAFADFLTDRFRMLLR